MPVNLKKINLLRHVNLDFDMEINLPRVDVHQNIDNIVVTLYLFDEFFSRVPHGRIDRINNFHFLN